MMNNLALSFRAQSLDNQSPDPVEVNKHLLGKEDVGERQKLAQKISKVSLDGDQVFSEGSHTASLHGDEFLLQTPSDQRDDAGRIAPILCYGCVPDEPSDSWPGDVVKALVDFAERIGRTVSDKSRKTAHRGVDVILNEKKKRWMRRRIMLWVAGGLVIVLVFWIIYKILFKE